MYPCCGLVNEVSKMKLAANALAGPAVVLSSFASRPGILSLCLGTAQSHSENKNFHYPACRLRLNQRYLVPTPAGLMMLSKRSPNAQVRVQSFRLRQVQGQGDHLGHGQPHCVCLRDLPASAGGHRAALPPCRCACSCSANQGCSSVCLHYQ